MINIEKVRLWSVHFARTMKLDDLPYPGCIVEEVESAGYHMPSCSPFNIPQEIGGQITLTLSGKGCLKVGEQHYTLVPGSAFLYRDCDPAVSYCYPENGKEVWRFVWINFMGAASEHFIAAVNRSYGYFFELGADNSLRERLLAYRSCSGATLFHTPLEGAMLFFELLHLLCFQAEQKTLRQNTGRLIREVRNEISHAFDESISTASLAKKFGITREHLSKTFHAETGQTLYDYRTEHKLSEAFNLLLKSNFSCKEIAQRCHYGSYSSFFRAFRKRYGISPEKFRKK